MLWRIVQALAIALALAFALPAEAQEKALKGVALVIGNGDYEHIAKLPNPANDARAVEEMLDRLGFETTLVSDRNARRLQRDLEGFAEDAAEADVAVVYYSGHGIEAGGENFLVPVDADLSALEDAGEKLVPVGALIEELKASVPVTIVMLDACRSNPFPPGAQLRTSPDAEAQPVTASGLGVARGAAPLSGNADRQETFGTVIGYAAEPGKVALDGPAGGNSPYAAAVLRHLDAMDGQEFGTVMRMVAEEVYLKTSGKQRPWVNESLRRLLYFGQSAQRPSGEEGDILAERRTLLLTIAGLPEAGRRQIETIAASDGVPMDALYGMLAALGAEAPRDQGELDRLLRSQTERIRSMLAEREALKSSDPEIARLSALSDQAIREGALSTAIKVLEEAKARVAALGGTVEEAEADIASKRLEFAAVYARSAEAHALAFDYAASARDYGEAYEQVRRWDDQLAWKYKHAQSDAYENQGSFKGDNAALERSIESARESIRIAETLPDRSNWAYSQNALGNALQTLGERERGTEKLDQAVVAFRAALSELTIEKDPKGWGGASNNLAITLAELGKRAQDGARLREAIGIYEQAVGVLAQSGDRQSWAQAQSNAGMALLALGELEGSIETLRQAGGAFEAGIGATSRTESPIVWGTMHNNLGNVMQAIGRLEQDQNAGAGWHVQAIATYHAALEEMTRERVPLQWASVQNNLANTYKMLAYRQADQSQAVNLLQMSATAQQSALLEMTRERVPLQWASLKWSVGQSLHMIAERTPEQGEAAARYRDAIAAYAEAAEELTPQRNAGQSAALGDAIGLARAALSQLVGDDAEARALLEAAETAQRAALADLATANRPPLERAALLHNLGMTFILLGDRGGGLESYRAAETVYREEEGLRKPEHSPGDWAKVQAGIGNALRAAGLITRDRATLEEARRRTQAAWDLIRPITGEYDGVLGDRMREIETALAGLQ